MRRNKREDIPTPAEELLNAYNLFIEVMENPQRAGYIGLVNKLRPESRALIDLKLFQKKETIDFKIKEVIEYILSIINFD